MGAICLIKRFKRRHNIVYITLASEGRSVGSETEDVGKITLLQEVKKYDLCDT
jgi:hypothetical protein